MLKEMQYGPFLYTYGTKLRDTTFYSDLQILMDSIAALKRRVYERIFEDQREWSIEDVIQEDLATLFRTTQVSKF